MQDEDLKEFAESFINSPLNKTTIFLGVAEENHSYEIKVFENYDKNEFCFYVIEGDWFGKFKNGVVIMLLNRKEGIFKTATHCYKIKPN